MISREKALEISKKWLKEAEGVCSLDGPYSYGELCLSNRKPNIYNITNTKLEDCWYFYYFTEKSKYSLDSTWILVLSQDNGSQVYFGSAGIEG
jgi:hypothetical protein